MGLFAKIKEMIKKIITPRLEAAKDYNQFIQQPYTITFSDNGEQLIVDSIEFINQRQNSNGEATDIMIAKANYLKNGDTINNENIAFEIKRGSQIDDIIMQKIGQYYQYEKNMPDNNKDCMYIGNISHDPYDLSTNNKSEVVKKYINEVVAPKKALEKQQIKAKTNKDSEIINGNRNSFVKELQKQQNDNNKQQNLMENPTNQEQQEDKDSVR